MAHRLSKKQRKARIDEKTGDSAVPSVRAAGIIAKLMIDTEHLVGLADKPGHDPGPDMNAALRKQQQEARWAEIAKLVAIINDDTITLSPDDVEIINDPNLVMTGDGEIAQRLVSGRDVIRRSGQFARHMIMPDLPTKKKKRKVSSYSKEFGIQLKKLKAKHPRTPVTRLMKRAHAATRKARK